MSSEKAFRIAAQREARGVSPGALGTCKTQTRVAELSRLKEKKATQIFDEDKVREYESKHDALWHELVQAHMSMYVVEKVLEFPADFLLDSERQTFLRLVLRNFTQQVALVVSNVFTDPDKRSLTFSSLQEWIGKHCFSEVRHEMSVYLGGLAEGNGIKSLLKRARLLRNKLLAHFDSEYATDPKKKAEAKIFLAELRSLLNRTEELVSGLCFGHGRSMLPLEYSPLVCHAHRADSGPDIDWILVLLAANSTIVRMPEEQKDYWPVYAAGLTQEQKKIFNQWRRRVGKKEIHFD